MARSTKVRRRSTILAIGTILAVAGIVSADTPAPVQEVVGTVLVPTRTPVSPLYMSGGAIQRMVYTTTGLNEVFGYTLDLEEASWGGRYELEVLSGATGREDVDIGFYVDLDPVSVSGNSLQRAVGGESGVVPTGTRVAHVILFDGARAEFRYRAYAPAEPSPGPPPDAAPLPATPGIHPDFGKGDSAFATTLRARSHVVIALVDTGINPYHRAFRRYEYGVHPSEYIEGFPADTPALGLTLDEPDYMAARAADDAAAWSQVQERSLYWIPGTNIVGARAEYDWSEGAPLPQGVARSRLILDDDGHGTGVASVAAGGSPRPDAAAFGSNPEALIVVVEGPSHQAVEWISEQPWIDFISGSYSPFFPLPYNDLPPGVAEALPPQLRNQTNDYFEHHYTGPFVLRDGRTVCFAAGNGLSGAAIAPDRGSSLNPMAGPSWVITVGAVSPNNEQDSWWHSIPVDVSSYGLWWPAASTHSTDGMQSFAGTSNATPLTCGVFSKVLLEARRTLGDVVEGIHIAPDGSRVPAAGPAGIAGGLLADGLLERIELEASVLKTALPGTLDPSSYGRDPWVVPDNPAVFTMEGYGIANVDSAQRAIAVIRGTAAMPDRSDVDAWIAAVDTFRDVLYPPGDYEG